MGLAYTISFLWGLAEATLFFVVPDVWLSKLAIDRSFRQVITGCLYTLIGALIGGMLMYTVGLYYHETLLHLIEKIPAIDSTMMHQVKVDLIQNGATAILLGPLTGTPYKIYAAQASVAALPFGWFVLISIPARFIRFFLISISVRTLSRTLFKQVSPSLKLTLLILCWSIFYLFYFLAFYR